MTTKLKKNSNFHKELSLQILTQLRKIIRAIDLNSKRLSTEANLTSPQILSLLAVHNNAPITIAKIAEEVHLSASTMVGIIDRLESKGLVLRERSKTDRRQVMVNITEEGRKVGKRAPVPLQEKLIQELDQISDTQQRNIIKSLEYLVEMLGAKNISALPILTPGAEIK